MSVKLLNTGLHVSAVSRMLKSGFAPHETNAIYMSDLCRVKEWFNGV